MSLRALLSYNETATNAIKDKSQHEIDAMRDVPRTPRRLLAGRGAVVHSSLPSQHSEVGALAAFRPQGIEGSVSVLENWCSEEQASSDHTAPAAAGGALSTDQGLITTRPAAVQGTARPDPPLLLALCFS